MRLDWETKEGNWSNLKRLVQEQWGKVFDRLVGEGWGDNTTQLTVVLALGCDNPGAERALICC